MVRRGARSGIALAVPLVLAIAASAAHAEAPRTAQIVEGRSMAGTRHAGERRFTFFELNAARARVSELWIGRGRVPTC